jgi:hypothetical protein
MAVLPGWCRYIPLRQFSTRLVTSSRPAHASVLNYMSFSDCAGILLEYEHRDGTQGMKEIDLLQLTPEYVCMLLAACASSFWLNAQSLM